MQAIKEELTEIRRERKEDLAEVKNFLGSRQQPCECSVFDSTSILCECKICLFLFVDRLVGAFASMWPEFLKTYREIVAAGNFLVLLQFSRSVFFRLNNQYLKKVNKI